MGLSQKNTILTDDTVGLYPGDNQKVTVYDRQSVSYRYHHFPILDPKKKQFRIGWQLNLQSWAGVHLFLKAV